jgi:MATE family multidrug resistance protein
LAEVRALVRLAWPVVLGQLGFTLLGIVDVAMVGRLGELELAALAAGHLWTFGVLIPGMALMLGLDPIFTQAHGANEPRAMGRTLWRAMLLVVLCSVPIIVGHIYAEEGLRLLQQPEEALDIAAGYSRALAWSVPGILVFQALRQYLLAMGRMMLPTLAVLAANVLNIGLNYALIEGRFGFPAMGAVGCGWAGGKSGAVFRRSRGSFDRPRSGPSHGRPCRSVARSAWRCGPSTPWACSWGGWVPAPSQHTAWP